jgi:hypothetical protein
MTRTPKQILALVNPKRRMPAVNVKRQAADGPRKYGPPARIRFVKSRPCAACSIVGYSENAHVLGNGGAGRKAGYETIAPLCGPHPGLGPFPAGCHRTFDSVRWMFDATFPEFNPERAAAETQAAWLLHSHRAGHQDDRA